MPLSTSALLLLNVASAQMAFSDGTDRLANEHLSSGVAMAVVDMNGDGLDDIVRLGDAINLEIEFQQADGAFRRYIYGPTSDDLQWSLAVADVDGNGVRDLFVGGARRGHTLLLGDATGEAWLGESFVSTAFTQGSSFADINNDGAVDLFICDDDGLTVPLRNDGSGAFLPAPELIDTRSTVPSDNSGNYGLVWTDFDSDGDLDLYLSKCKIDVSDPGDGRRLNLLFENDGAGAYQEVAAERGLQPGGQSWSTDFGDLDNDGDLDAFVLNHDIPSVLYLNDGTGHFSDVTAGSGIVVEDIVGGIQVLFEDLDNDTYLDLLITATDGLHYVYRNQGDGTFREQFELLPSGGKTLQTATIGDLDNDGDLDILGGFASSYNYPVGIPDQLFLNESPPANWMGVRLRGHSSNRDGIGARIELYGAWGQQVREVRGGEGYGITRSFTRHFGLGQENSADRLVIRWPSGQVSTIEDPPVNAVLLIDELCVDLDGDGVCQEEDWDDTNPRRSEQRCGCASGGGLPGGLFLPVFLLRRRFLHRG